MSNNDNRKTFAELGYGDSVFIVTRNTQDGLSDSIVEYTVSHLSEDENCTIRCIINFEIKGLKEGDAQYIRVINVEQDIQVIDGLIVCSNFAALSNYIEKINSDYRKLANELILDRVDYLEYKRLKNVKS